VSAKTAMATVETALDLGITANLMAISGRASRASPSPPPG
jgi:hypothetical protein